MASVTHGAAVNGAAGTGAMGTGAAHAAPVRRTTPGQALASAVPDSLFDHSADFEFVLDPVKIRRERGRGYTPVTSSVRGQTASITF